MQIKCLVIDDEPLSQEVIADFVNACPELNLAGICNDAIEAGEFLKTHPVDLLFLDINMPRLSGIGFVKSLKDPPLFVFVTAYPEYALDGFEVDAVDYLVKPVSFERFRKTVNRILERIEKKNESKNGHILLRANKKDYRIEFENILYLEAQGDYVKFVTTERYLMVHGTMKEFMDHLPENLFERIHKSYIIKLSKVEYLEGNTVKIGEYKLPVSLNYREQLHSKLR
jgi:two-component system, LytTR family, response regulator